MLKFFYNTAPNPIKVALLLEELGLPYEPHPVDTRKGEQFSPAFVAINPNSKVPAIVDGDVTMFDSNAILLFLADREQRFVPRDPRSAERAQALSWLMFVASGIGPYSGQAVHFKRYAPEPIPYAVDRYNFEAWRHWNIIEAHLSKQSHMVGNSYSLVDMALWGWARAAHLVLGDDAMAKLPNVKRLLGEINARPAAQRVDALKAQYTFKSEMDEQARKAFFPHMA